MPANHSIEIKSPSKQAYLHCMALKLHSKCLQRTLAEYQRPVYSISADYEKLSTRKSEETQIKSQTEKRATVFFEWRFWCERKKMFCPMARQADWIALFIILRKNFKRKMFPNVFNVLVVFDFHPFWPANEINVEAMATLAKPSLWVCILHVAKS